MRSLTLFASFALLFSIAGLSYSSEARQFELDRLQFDRMWSGVLGCAERSDPFVTRDRFDSSDSLEDIDDGSVPTGASTDYSQCGRLALRSASSRILVDGIEDAIRQGGLALFEENFRLDSSIGYVWDENVTGEVDAVIPLGLDSHGNGVDRALFFQPGLVFWTGLEDEERIDGNIGLVYRRLFSPDLIAGGSLFYDYDFKRKHERLGLGVDLQSGALQAGLNYYHPISDWTEGRTDYEEQALRGVDLRAGITWEYVRFDAGMGWWRFEGEDEERTKWRPSFDIELGYRIYPGVFLQGGYERQDSGDSLGSRWNAGLAFQFSLPGLDGATVLADAGTTPNLYEPVEREKRILYEERLGIPRVNLSALDADGQPVRGAHTVTEPQSEDETVVVEVMAELGKPLDEDVMLNIVIAESSTADLGMGEDFTYRHGVYVLDPETGEQSAPTDENAVMDCPTVMCPVMIPMGVTRFDIEATILLDTESMERAEFIDFEIEVPDDYAQLVRAGGGARVTIGAHGNTVEFATNAATTLSENRAGPTSNGAPPDPETVEVAVSVDLDSPTPITLDVETGGTAVEGTDYRISTRRLTIPANADSASLTLTGIDNTERGNKMIELTISGNLPSGWEFGDAEHTVMIRDDDRSISLSSTPDEVEEPATSDIMHDVTVSISEAPTADITVMVSAGGTGETATAGSDYTFAQQSFTFTAGDDMESNLNQTFSIAIHADTERELEEMIVLTIADDDPSSRDAEGSGFALGGPFTITIPPNDNTVAFASDAAVTLDENTAGPTSNGADPMPETQTIGVSVNLPAPRDITLGIMTGGTAEVGTDYTISATSLTIPEGQDRGEFTLTTRDNSDGEAPPTIDLTLEMAGALPDGWTLDTTTHTVRILDDDAAVGFNMTMEDVAEPSATGAYSGGAGVRLTSSPAAAVTVRYGAVPEANIGTVPGIPAGAVAATLTGTGQDIMFPAGRTFTFAANASGNALTQALTGIQIVADDTPEPDEYVALQIQNDNSFTDGNNNFSRSPEYLIFRIPANDNTVAFAAETSTLSENTTGPTSNNATVTPGTQEVAVNVNVAAPSDITVGIMIDSSNSTAVEGTHYSISAKSLTINATQTSGTITLTSMDNTASPETPLQIVLMLTGTVPDGWTLGTATHTVTITDDDTAVGFTQATLDIEEPASDMTYGGDVGVRLTTTPAATVTVTYEVITDLTTLPSGLVPSGAVAATTASGTGQDIEFPTSKTFTFSTTDMGADLMEALADVSIKADTDYEPDEYVVLKIMDHMSFKGNGNNFNTGPEYLVIKIPANDHSVVNIRRLLAPRLSEARTDTFNFTVAVAPTFSEDITFNLDFSGEAEAGVDYDFRDDSDNLIATTPRTATIEGGENGVNIGIRAIQNTDDEPNKELIITISAPSAGLPEGVIINMEESTRTILIADDDVPADKIGFDTASSQNEIKEDAGGAVFTLEFASALPSETRINIGIDVDGTSNPSDYEFAVLDPVSARFDNSNKNLAILAANSPHFTFSISVPNDTNTGDKTLTLTLTGESLPLGWSLGSVNAPATWELKIRDDD